MHQVPAKAMHVLGGYNLQARATCVLCRLEELDASYKATAQEIATLRNTNSQKVRWQELSAPVQEPLDVYNSHGIAESIHR